MRGVLSKRVRLLPSAHPTPCSCPARAPTQPNGPFLTRLRPDLCSQQLSGLRSLRWWHEAELVTYAGPYRPPAS